MKNDRTEYLPVHDEQPHQKVFRLAPVQDDVTYRVIQSRLDALRDRNLSLGAKVLYCFILDLSMSPYTHVVRGVVIISATKMCESVNCCRESIFGWIKQLTAGRFVWVDKAFMPNFWAMNRYHITALDAPDQPQQLPTRDGLWGNGVRRPEAPRSGFTAGVVVENSARQIPAENTDSQQNQPQPLSDPDASGGKTGPEASKNPHATRLKNLTGRVQKTAPGASEKPDAAHPINPTAAVEKPAHIRPSRTEKVGLERVLQSSKRNSQTSMGAPERDFLERIGRVIGAKALVNFGAQWRARFREDPEKAERVLADVNNAVASGEVRSSAGGMANCLWNDFASRRASK